MRLEPNHQEQERRGRRFQSAARGRDGSVSQWDSLTNRPPSRVASRPFSPPERDFKCDALWDIFELMDAAASRAAKETQCSENRGDLKHFKPCSSASCACRKAFSSSSSVCRCERRDPWGEEVLAGAFLCVSSSGASLRDKKKKNKCAEGAAEVGGGALQPANAPLVSFPDELPSAQHRRPRWTYAGRTASSGAEVRHLHTTTAIDIVGTHAELQGLLSSSDDSSQRSCGSVLGSPALSTPEFCSVLGGVFADFKD